MATTLTRVDISDVLEVPAEDLWRVLRDFDALPRYHPFFASSHIEDSLPADRIGCVRNFQEAEGDGTVREQLLALDDEERRCAYRIVGGSPPVRSYLSEVRIWTVSEQPGRCFGRWWAEFEALSGEAEAFAARVEDTFRLGFRGAAEIAAGRGKPKL